MPAVFFSHAPQLSRTLPGRKPRVIVEASKQKISAFAMGARGVGNPVRTMVARAHVRGDLIAKRPKSVCCKIMLVLAIQTVSVQASRQNLLVARMGALGVEVRVRMGPLFWSRIPATRRRIAQASSPRGIVGRPVAVGMELLVKTMARRKRSRSNRMLKLRVTQRMTRRQMMTRSQMVMKGLQEILTVNAQASKQQLPVIRMVALGVEVHVRTTWHSWRM
jgi:hypothetical protein